ncbi:hypothetical protein ABIF00_008761 [Bradyrhizobium elkanii]
MQFLVGDFEERLVGAGAGIVDQDVDAAEAIAGERRQPLDLLQIGHIKRQRFDLDAGAPLDVRTTFGQRVLAARADQNLDTLLRQQAYGLETNALAAAGDDRRLAFKSKFHLIASL